MNWLNYILKGFGYRSAADFNATVFKIDGTWLWLSAALGSIRWVLSATLGLDLAVFAAFVFLIIAEFQTGLTVSMRLKGEKFQSRKFGRMILKIGVFCTIIMVLYALSKAVTPPAVFGFEVNPFLWLHYFVFTAIVFQMFVSWMENLGCLGYKETKTIAGFVLRKFNRWFEFDGSKDNGEN